MVPREGENLGRTPVKPNEYEKEMTKGQEQETIDTTAKPMQIHSTTNHMEAKNGTGRGGKNHGSVKPHISIFRILHYQYTREIRQNEGYQTYNKPYAR